MPLPAAWGEIRRTSEAAIPAADRASRDDEPDALGPLRMGKSNKRIAQLIRLFEQEHEAGHAGAGDRAHDQRQNGQEREAPALPFSLALASQFGNHSLGQVSTAEG